MFNNGQCTVCMTDGYNTALKRANHKRVHDDPVECETCGQPMKNKHSLVCTLTCTNRIVVHPLTCIFFQAEHRRSQHSGPALCEECGLVFESVSRLYNHKYKLHTTVTVATPTPAPSEGDARLMPFSTLTKKELRNNCFPSFNVGEIHSACVAAWTTPNLSALTISNIFRAYLISPNISMLRDRCLRDNTAADYSRRMRRLITEFGARQFLRDFALEVPTLVGRILEVVIDRLNYAVGILLSGEERPKGYSVQHAKNDVVAMISFQRFARAVKVEMLTAQTSLDFKETLFTLKLSTALSNAKHFVKLEAARRPHSIADYGMCVPYYCADSWICVELFVFAMRCVTYGLRAEKLGQWREAEQVVLGFASSVLAFYRCLVRFRDQMSTETARTALVAANDCVCFLFAVISGGQRRQMYQLLEVLACHGCGYVCMFT